MSRPGLSYPPLESSWSLGSVILEVCTRAGVSAELLNVDRLEGSVEGFSITNAQTAAAAIEALSSVFFFDPANYDGVLNFVPRGGAVAADIDLDDLIDNGDDVEVDTRRDSIEVPRTLNLQYYDTEGGLTPDKQTSDRTLDSRAVAETTIDTTVIMRADDAARVAVIKHKVLVEESRGSVQFSLPDNWLSLVTSNVIRFRGQRVRIVEFGLDDGFQTYKAIYDRVSAYESSIQGVPIDQPATPPGLVADETRFEVIDSHILQSSDDALGYYVAVSSVGLDWKGAYIELSRDGGANWTDSGATTANAVIGSTLSAMPARSEYIRDDFSVLTVQLLRTDMELIPATMAEMMNRMNVAIVGNEIINFSDAEQIDETTWQLRGLLRGRRGSGAVAHAVGERFVLLELEALEFVDAELYDMGRSLTFRGTSIGREGPDQTKTVAYIGRSQKERAPAYLQAKRDGSSITVSWQGVGRTGGGTAIGMGAYFTGYRVTLGSHTVDTMSRTVTIPYTAGALSVRQLNSITGAGPASTVSV